SGDVDKASSSSSHEKFTFALPQIRRAAFHGQAPDLVIAFGTAGIPSPETLNGCVTIGSRAYVRDAWERACPEEIAKQVERFGPLLREEIAGQTNKRLPSHLSKELFQKLDTEVRHAA